MKEAIRQRARELGFDDCRITTAEAPRSAGHFQRWLADGKQGEMGYLERTAPKRADLRQVLANAVSVITLAVNYDGSRPSDIEPEETIPAGGVPRIGFVARYARHGDYHHILGRQLKDLSAFVNQLGGDGTQSLWYVDTGPILERDLAQRAGLGFIGKHTNLISRRLGNWIFVSEILTTLELEPDAPEKNRCGSCARCISACPTRAITGPFQLDARLCISYLTIELKGSIPVELRPALGNRIYGCDDCLAVCPWNRFARQGEMMKQHARVDLSAPELVELLSLDDSGFKGRFASTPMLRVKRRGLLRNVCVALGNTAGAEALPALRVAANEAEPLVAEHAAWAIEQIGKRQGPAD
jgi:epoxyqueuosine reductase